MAEEKYDILSVRPFVPEMGFPMNNLKFHTFLYNRRNSKMLCEHPNLGGAPLVHEFHANLRDKNSSIIFVREFGYHLIV